MSDKILPPFPCFLNLPLLIKRGTQGGDEKPFPYEGKEQRKQIR